MNKPVQSKTKELLALISNSNSTKSPFIKIFRHSKYADHVTLFWEHDWTDNYDRSGKFTRFYANYGKRYFDIIISLAVIFFVLSWLVPVVALLIYADSPGPFYFIQLRTGHHGKPFNCFKFRTMVYDKTGVNFTQTARDDTRITKIGKFLRKTNLDELLQFINVLSGHMTLVGPRPHAISHDAMYWHVSRYQARYSVKPGITGLAQIRGARGATEQTQSMHNRIRYDHLYMKKQTFTLDMKIFVRTIWLTITGDPNAW